MLKIMAKRPQDTGYDFEVKSFDADANGDDDPAAWNTLQFYRRQTAPGDAFSRWSFKLIEVK